VLKDELMVFQLLSYVSHTYFSFRRHEMIVHCEQKEEGHVHQIDKTSSLSSSSCISSIDDLIRQEYYIFDRLIEDETPALFAHFKAFNVSPVLFSATWFETLFARTFTARHLGQVWDFLFLSEKKHQVFAIGLALLKLEASNLLKQQGFEILIASCRSLGNKIPNISLLLKTAASFSSTIQEKVNRFAEDWAHPLTEKEYLCF